MVEMSGRYDEEQHQRVLEGHEDGEGEDVVGERGVDFAEEDPPHDADHHPAVAHHPNHHIIPKFEKRSSHQTDP